MFCTSLTHRPYFYNQITIVPVGAEQDAEGIVRRMEHAEAATPLGLHRRVAVGW